MTLEVPIVAPTSEAESLDMLRSTVREVVGLLVAGDYEGICQRLSSRLTSEELLAVVRNYGRELVLPPNDSYRQLDAMQARDTTIPTWSIRVPLWTEEEGRSDLTLELTIALGAGDPRIDLDDLHVL